MFARRVVAHHNLSDVIQVHHTTVETLELAEAVDIVLSEWMGKFLLKEGMLPSVIHARDTMFGATRSSGPNRSITSSTLSNDRRRALVVPGTANMTVGLLGGSGEWIYQRHMDVLRQRVADFQEEFCRRQGKAGIGIGIGNGRRRGAAAAAAAASDPAAGRGATNPRGAGRRRRRTTTTREHNSSNHAPIDLCGALGPAFRETERRRLFHQYVRACVRAPVSQSVSQSVSSQSAVKQHCSASLILRRR